MSSTYHIYIVYWCSMLCITLTINAASSSLPTETPADKLFTILAQREGLAEETVCQNITSALETGASPFACNDKGETVDHALASLVSEDMPFLTTHLPTLLHDERNRIWSRALKGVTLVTTMLNHLRTRLHYPSPPGTIGVLITRQDALPSLSALKSLIVTTKVEEIDSMFAYYATDIPTHLEKLLTLLAHGADPDIALKGVPGTHTHGALPTYIPLITDALKTRTKPHTNIITFVQALIAYSNSCITQAATDMLLHQIASTYHTEFAPLITTLLVNRTTANPTGLLHALIRNYVHHPEVIQWAVDNESRQTINNLDNTDSTPLDHALTQAVHATEDACMQARCLTTLCALTNAGARTRRVDALSVMPIQEHVCRQLARQSYQRLQLYKHYAMIINQLGYISRQYPVYQFIAALKPCCATCATEHHYLCAQNTNPLRVVYQPHPGIFMLKDEPIVPTGF